MSYSHHGRHAGYNASRIRRCEDNQGRYDPEMNIRSTSDSLPTGYNYERDDDCRTAGHPSEYNSSGLSDDCRGTQHPERYTSSQNDVGRAYDSRTRSRCSTDPSASSSGSRRQHLEGDPGYGRNTHSYNKDDRNCGSRVDVEAHTAGHGSSSGSRRHESGLRREDRKRRNKSNDLGAPRKLSCLQKLMKSCKKHCNLPDSGEFMNLFKWTDTNCGQVKDIHAIGSIVRFGGSNFYVRHETLRVLENFKHFMDVKLGTKTAENPKEQFIFVGSRGMGKSCLLSLICFYLAVVKRVPVVWFRVGGDWPVTRFLDRGKYYEWIDVDNKIYDKLCHLRSGVNQSKCWFCLDGLTQQDVKKRDLTAFYTVLAVSGQFRRNGERAAKQLMCLVPYWRQEDLEDLAEKLGKLSKSDVASQISVSGGSVRDFMLPNQYAMNYLEAGLSELTPGNADILLNTRGCYPNDQIERVRMMGVTDTRNAELYTRLSCWRSCVTSMMALKHLVDMVTPNFFLKLVIIAKELNDPCALGIALESLFRSHLHCQHCVRISCYEYDMVDRRGVRNVKGTITFRWSMESDEPMPVKREGNRMEDYVSVMTRWAENPDEMDYWAPASSNSKTIDGVARWQIVGESPESSNDGPLEVQFCLLQVVSDTTHKCDEVELWAFAKPFLDAGKPVCYIALVFDDDSARGESAEDKLSRFRSDPVQLKLDAVKDNIPLYVATYKVLEGLRPSCSLRPFA